MSSASSLDDLFEDPFDSFDVRRALQILSHRVRTQCLSDRADGSQQVSHDFIVLRGRDR